MANQPLGQMIIELGLDSSNFANSMDGAKLKLKSAMIEMKAHLNVMGRSGEETDKLAAKQTGLNSVVEAQNKVVQEAKAKYEACKLEVEKSASASDKQKDALIKTRNEYVKSIGQLGSYQSQLLEVNGRLLALESNTYKMGSALEDAGKKIAGVGKGMTSLGKTLSIGVTAPLLAVGTGATKAAMEWQSSFAGVKKTVDEVVDANGNVTYSYAQIEKSLLDLSETIPMTTTEIAGVAEAAGQLGIATEDVVDFTTVMLNLGSATNLTAEDAASSLAKMINITGMTSDKYENLGSSIVALGNNMATTEADIVNMATRMASAGTQAGMTEADIMAIAASMSSLGMESQAGGSSMMRVINDINSSVISGSDALDIYAKTAGISAGEFATAWREDAAGALNTLVVGLNKAGNSGEDLTAILGQMGISSTGDTRAMMALATSSTVLSDALDISKNAWEENTALATEAETKYATFESQMQMTKNKINNVAIEAGGPLLVALGSAVDAAKPVIDIFKGMAERFSGASKETQEMIIKIATIAVVTGPALAIVGKMTTGIGKMTTGLGKGMKSLAEWAGKVVASSTATTVQTVATTANTVATTASTAAEGAKTVATGTSTTAIVGQALAITGQTIVTNICTVATNAFNAALTLLGGPIKLAIAGVVALAAGAALLVAWFKKESKASKELKEDVANLAEEQEAYRKTIEESAAAHEDKAKKMKQDELANKAVADKIKELSSLENKSASQKRELAGYVNQLNSSMVGLNLQYDEQTDALNMTTDAIYSNIDAAKLQEERDSSYERRTQLIVEQTEANENLVGVQAKIKEAEENTALKQKERDKILEELREQEDGYLTDLENLSAELGVVESAIEEMSAAQSEAAEIAAAAMEAQKAATEQAMPTILEAYGTLGDAYEDLGERQQDALDGILDAYDTMTNSLSSLSKKIELDSETTWASIQENQADTIIKTQEFSELYAQLIEAGVSESYLKAIGATGPESIPLIQGMLEQGTDTVLASQGEWEAAYGTIGDTLVDALNLGDEASAAITEYIQGESGIVGSLKNAIEAADLNSIGVSVTEGLSLGILESVENADEATKEMVNSLIGEAKEGLDINSPSKVFEEIGGYITEGLALGISNNQELLSSAFETIVPTAMENINASIAGAIPEITEIFTTGFTGAGTSVNTELAKMSSNINVKLTSIATIVNSKVNTLKTVITSGFTAMNTIVVSGMRTMQTAITNSFTTIATNAITGMNNFQKNVATGMTNSNESAKAGATIITSSLNMQNSMHSNGLNAMIGFESGLNARAASVYATANNIANNVAKTVQNALDIHSPSRVLKKLGGYTMEGFALGIKETEPQINAVVEDTVGIVTDGLNKEFTMPELTTDSEFVQSMKRVIEVFKPKPTEANKESRVEELLENMISLLTTLTNQQQNHQIIMDTGAVVGEILPAINNGLGKIRDRRERGN